MNPLQTAVDEIHVELLTLGIWYMVVIFAAGLCLRYERGIDRLTWLVAILFLPIFGVLFYGVRFWTREE